MIGLAVGAKAVASGPEGTVFGEDVLKAYFKHDLGFTSKFPLLPVLNPLFIDYSWGHLRVA